jgi:ketosteroid isomerase-like protein
MMRSATPNSTRADAIRAIQVTTGDASVAIDRLNDAYIRAYLDSDVTAFEALLSDTFLVTLNDGRLLGKALFLSLVARPAGVTSHQVEDLRIRVYGDCAIVNATTVFTREDGTAGETRYTDVYARVDGRWRAVAAHLTSVASTNEGRPNP